MNSQRRWLRRFWFRLIHGWGRALRPYERTCLDRIRAGLDAEAGSILDGQLASIGLVQRFSNDKMVMFGFLPEETLPLFDNQAYEARIARLFIRDSGGVHYRVDLVLHDGRLSSLEFSRPPEDLKTRLFEVVRVDTNSDLRDSTAATAVTGGTKAFLPKLESKLTLGRLRPPASETDIGRFVADMSCSLPADYLGLLRECDGFTGAGWEFYGTRARRILLPERNLWLVAEADTTALCFEEGSAAVMVLEYSEEDDEVREAGHSFVDAFMAVVSR